MTIMQLERTRRTGRLTIVPCEPRTPDDSGRARRVADVCGALRLETFELYAAIREVERDASRGLPLRHGALAHIVASALDIAAHARRVQSEAVLDELDLEADVLRFGVPI